MKRLCICIGIIICLFTTSVVTKAAEKDFSIEIAREYIKKSRLLQGQAKPRVQFANFLHNYNMKRNLIGIIDSQKGSVSKMKFGDYTVGGNGCGSIALHNALALSGQQRNYPSVILQCEKITMISAGFGCNPYRFGELLEYYGIKNYSYAENYSEIDTVSENSRVMITCFWNGDTIFKGMHIVTVLVKPDGSVRAYNCSKKTFSSFEEYKKKYLTEKRFMSIYGLK